MTRSSSARGGCGAMVTQFLQMGRIEMSCTYTPEELTAFAIGELDETRTAEMEKIMAKDPKTQQEVYELRGIANLLMDELGDEPAGSLTGDQRRAIQSADRPGRRLSLRAALSLAASIALLLGAAFLLAGRQSNPPTPEPDKANHAGLQFSGTLAPEPNRPQVGGRGNMVPIPIEYPKGGTCCFPHPINEPNVDKPPRENPAPFLAPKGTINLARGKPVTSNESLPVVGSLEMITDGAKSGEDGHNVDIGFDLKWVQIDLQASSRIHAIVMWHYFGQVRVYRDVVLRVSDDPIFRKYTTVFNNDYDNSSKLGVGKDKGYFETNLGKLIDCKGVTGRYVRLYSKGNSSNDQNHYIEVEVYGQALKSKAPTTRPAPSSEAKKIPLTIKYPKARYRGTPPPMPNEPNMERRRRYRRPEPLLVPRGTVNLALKKTVTSNEPFPIIGDLDMVTDGDKSPEDGHSVDIGFGVKWVQVDLESDCDIRVIGVWRTPGRFRAFRDVAIRISDDPDFVNFTTIFNSDHDNSSGLGIGSDMAYCETIYGKLIDCGGIRGRYVRFYSNGNSSDDENYYTEIEIYGRKVKWWAPARSIEAEADKAELKVKYPKLMFH